MFNNILIPISSEFFSRRALLRGSQLAKAFDSDVTIVYIIEEKMFHQLDKMSDTFRTTYEQEKTWSNLKSEYKSTADSIIFGEAQRLFSDFKHKIKQGEFSTVVHQELMRFDYDLVIMGFEKGCLMDYRLLDDSPVPIWVESGREGNQSMLAVCSNISPNQKVPNFSKKLAKSLGWHLYMLYVVDVQDAVEVDSNGIRSNKKTKHDLCENGKEFVMEMQQQGISAKQVQGSLEREIPKAAHQLGVELVIVGREQKERRILGIPTHNTKKKLAKKCPYSLLFIS